MKEDLLYFPGWEEPFILELAGISWCDGSYKIYRSCSPIWVLEQVIQGTGTVVIDGVPQSVSAGDCYLLPLGTPHQYFSDSENPWVKIFMNVRGQLPAAIFSVYGLTGQTVFRQAKLERLFEQFYHLAGSKQPDLQTLCSIKLHQICAQLGKLNDYSSKISPEAAAMKSYLDQNISELVSISQLANQIYRSPDYASKLFRKTYGITPYAYLLQQKIQLACRLLQSTALPVQEISSRLGYEDAHYFSGLFHRYMGVSPSDYRKAGKEEPSVKM